MLGVFSMLQYTQMMIDIKIKLARLLILPILNKEIPLIADDYVDMEFGTGCVKITPSHDPK